MARFKVGDRVTVSISVSEIWVEYYGTLRQPARIVGVGHGDYVIELEKPCAKDDGKWIVVDNEITPAAPDVPEGWTPASEPPDSDRNVRVVLKDGREWYGWYYEGGSEDGPAWLIIHDGEDMSRINADKLCDARDAAPGEVIAWREIEPAAKPAAQVRYAVRYSNTVKDKDDDGDYYLTMDEAAVEAKRLVAKYGKEIEVGHWVVDAVVKPAEPEVIRMEE